MRTPPAQITLAQWESRYDELKRQQLSERFYGGPLSRHAQRGDKRLCSLKLDNSPAALALWNLLLTENARLNQTRARGKKIVGVMKDLGTIPVMAYAFENLVAFYPDGAWWTPCFMQQEEGLFEIASRQGLDESFCPVRAMLGAFLNERHFPKPDTLVCSAGAICDDFSAVAQRLEQLGFAIHWWEIPHRRQPEQSEDSITLTGGLKAPRSQVDFVKTQLHAVIDILEQTACRKLTAEALIQSVNKANRFRHVLEELRWLVYTSDPCPLGSLEMLAAEMLVLHYCSDYIEALLVLQGLLDEVRSRALAGTGVLSSDAARVFWVNPPADLKVMNLLEDSGGRLCGTDFMFSHTLGQIRRDIEPIEALAQTALSDPMVGSSRDRAEDICRQAVRFGAEGIVVSHIPGASHCALEAAVIGQTVRDALELPVVEVEVQTLCDSTAASIRTRMEALIENIIQRRQA